MATVNVQLEKLAEQRIREIAATLDAEKMGEDMGDYLIASIPELVDVPGDADFRDGLILSCTSNVAEICDCLLTGAHAANAVPPPDATTWAHELVHRGKPLAALLRAYRLGHWLFEQVFEERTAEFDLDPDVRQRVLAQVSQFCFHYIDIVCTQLVDEYETEREQWMRGAAAAQADLVQAIVAEEKVDPSEATATLRYDVGGTQLAFIVWADGRVRNAAGGESPAALAKQLGAEFGAAQTLVVPIGEHVAWAWATGDGLLDGLPSRSALLEDHAHVAVGAAHPGLEGMARSHREARSARRVADIFGLRPGAVVRFPTVALTSLISADPAQAVAFVAAELGELAADTDPIMRLRATIKVYLDEKLSPSRTARRLGIHQNTVIYRVKRAEELVGRPIEDRRLELEIALRLFEGLDGLTAAPA